MAFANQHTLTVQLQVPIQMPAWHNICQDNQLADAPMFCWLLVSATYCIHTGARASEAPSSGWKIKLTCH